MDKNILEEILYAIRHGRFWHCYNIENTVIDNKLTELDGPYIPSYTGEKFYNTDFLAELISGKYIEYKVNLEFCSFIKVIGFSIFKGGEKISSKIEINIFDLEAEPSFKDFLERETDIASTLLDGIRESEIELKELYERKSDIEESIDFEEDFIRITKKLFTSVALLDELEK